MSGLILKLHGETNIAKNQMEFMTLSKLVVMHLTYNYSAGIIGLDGPCGGLMFRE